MVLATSAFVVVVGVLLGAWHWASERRARLEQQAMQRMGTLETRVDELDERLCVQEVGAVTFTIPEGVTIGYTSIKFERVLSDNTIVLTGETGSGGTFLVTKTEALTPTGCRVAVQQNNMQPFGSAHDARIAYVVMRGAEDLE